MAKVLTSRTVDAARPKAGKRYGISDGLVPGMQLIVHSSGAKTYILLCRLHGRQINLKIGSAAALTLAQAREEAKRKLALAARGEDPRAATREAQASAATTFGVVVPEFIERHAKVNNRSWRATELILTREVLPVWRNWPVGTVSKRDVIALLDAVKDRGAPAAANALRIRLGSFFSWCVDRDLLETSPCFRVKAPTKDVKRTRVLDDHELTLVWKAAEQTGYPWGPIVKLLILSGQRRCEVAEMPWDELDSGLTLWTLPPAPPPPAPARTKNGREHFIPVTAAMRAVLVGLPRIPSEANYVFTLTGRGPYTSFNRAKQNLDTLITALNGNTPIAPWTPHDLRRSAITGMAKLGVPVPTIEKVVNHSSGTFSGIVATYQHHDFMEERRAALELWGAHVLALARGETPRPALRVAASR